MIDSEEAFDKFLGHAIETARGFVEDGREALHIIMLVGPTGMDVIPFALVEQELRELGQDVDAARKVAYKFASVQAISRRCLGYVEVSEAFMMHYGQSKDMEAAKVEHEKMCDKYGSLAKTPGSIEMLFVRARWKAKKFMHVWKIGRREGSKPYLYDHDTYENDTKGTRAEPLDVAIDFVLAEPK